MKHKTKPVWCELLRKKKKVFTCMNKNPKCILSPSSLGRDYLFCSWTKLVQKIKLCVQKGSFNLHGQDHYPGSILYLKMKGHPVTKEFRLSIEYLSLISVSITDFLCNLEKCNCSVLQYLISNLQKKECVCLVCKGFEEETVSLKVFSSVKYNGTSDLCQGLFSVTVIRINNNQ